MDERFCSSVFYCGRELLLFLDFLSIYFSGAIVTGTCPTPSSAMAERYYNEYMKLICTRHMCSLSCTQLHAREAVIGFWSVVFMLGAEAISVYS